MHSLPHDADTHEKAGLRVGYFELLRSNRNFRNLWFGQVVSELGDWFSTVALFNLLLELTNRAQAVGWFLIIIHLPSVIMGPIAGVLVDRLDRKRLMITMDLVRAGLVLGYILIRRADQVWLIYLIGVLEVAMAMVFEPARTATVPNICHRRELVAANAISSVTWSAMLTLGAAIGGLVTAAFGRKVSFVIDSLSFLASALMIRRASVPPHPRLNLAFSQFSSRETPWAGFQDVLDGWRYVGQHPPVFALLLVKTGWCLGGGLLLVLSVFGQKIFPVMGSGAAGIGVLFAARGIGTGIGPFAARALAGERKPAMRKAITSGFFLASVFYIFFGHSPWLPIASLALMIAHMGGSITWVFSTVLLQLEVPDEYRGRVFSMELALLTLAIALSNYFTGYGLDVLGLAPRFVATLLGFYFVVPALIWMAIQRVFKK